MKGSVLLLLCTGCSFFFLTSSVKGKLLSDSQKQKKFSAAHSCA